MIARAKPAIGRIFAKGDGELGAPPTAILSDQLWRSQFKADPKTVGQVIRIGGVPHTRDRRHAARVPLSRYRYVHLDRGRLAALSATSKEMQTERGYNFLNLVGRLRPRSDPRDQARADLDTTAKSIAKDDPKEAKGL